MAAANCKTGRAGSARYAPQPDRGPRRQEPKDRRYGQGHAGRRSGPRRATNQGDDQEETTADTWQSNKLGLAVTELTAAQAESLGYKGLSGVLISKVEPDGVAAEQGLRPGMLVMKVGTNRSNRSRSSRPPSSKSRSPTAFCCWCGPRAEIGSSSWKRHTSNPAAGRITGARGS